MNYFIVLVMSIFVLSSCSDNNQNLQPGKDYYTNIVRELSSANYYGRSNYNDGAKKAAKFIINELQSIGIGPVPESVIEKAWQGKNRPELHSLQPEFKSLISPSDPARWSNGTKQQLSYLQHFIHPLNAQRGRVELMVDGDTLEHTVKYTLKEFSPTFKGELDVVYLDNKYITPDKFCAYLNSGEFMDKAVVLDWDYFVENMYTYKGIEVYKTYFVPLDKVGALICKSSDKSVMPYFKSRNHYNTPMPVFMVEYSFPEDAKKVFIDVEGKMIENDGHNIIAYIPGTKHAEKHFVLACHYDHLGVCGKNIFYGANDNASGIAMLLNIIRYFKQTPPDYSLLFIFFDSEENNLLGSFFYADNPLLPLEDIRYFVELDMIGDNGNNIYCQISETGHDGLDTLTRINSLMEYPFAQLNNHPLDDYADHYPFGIKGVPAIYIELDGDTNKNYHSPRDNFQNFHANNFNRIFTLVTKFVEEY